VASSYTASEIHHLQNEILEQSKQIEQFIATADASESSFLALKTLFSLFKSELSVNLSLRQLFVDQRKAFESANASVDDFLQRVHGLGYENADDLTFVLTVLQSQLKKLRRMRRVRRAAVHEIRNSEVIAEHLQVQEAENSVFVASLNTQLSRAQTDITSLRQQLNESESRICDLRTMLNCSEVERRKLETSLGESESMRQRIAELEQERDLLIAKKGRWSQRVKNGEAKVDELTNQIAELQLSFAQEIDDIHAQYRLKTDRAKEAHRRRIEEVDQRRQKAMDELTAANQLDREKAQLLHRRELEELRKAHQSELQLLRSQCESEGQKSESIIRNQNERIQELENSVRQFEAGKKTIEDDDQITRQKCERLFRKVRSLRNELERIVESHQQEVSKLRKEHERREQQTRATLEEQLTAEVNKCNVVERELRLEVNEQQIENKRLREQLRQYSYILEQKEGMLAKLQSGGETVEEPSKSRRTRESHLTSRRMKCNLYFNTCDDPSAPGC
jgi:hypothetical protein